MTHRGRSPTTHRRSPTSSCSRRGRGRWPASSAGVERDQIQHRRIAWLEREVRNRDVRPPQFEHDRAAMGIGAIAGFDWSHGDFHGGHRLVRRRRDVDDRGPAVVRSEHFTRDQRSGGCGEEQAASAIGEPSAFRATTEMVDIELPSWTGLAAPPSRSATGRTLMVRPVLALPGCPLRMRRRKPPPP